MNEINPKEFTSPLVIYSKGLCFCSVCAPVRYTAQMVEQEVNRINPTGIYHGWFVSKDKNFRTGQTNPCPCNDTNGERQHWLMVC